MREKHIQAEEALRESEERHRLVLDSAPDPIVTYDPQGRTTYVNLAFTEMFGWSLDELLGQRLDFVPDEKKAELQETIHLFLTKGKVPAFETKRLTKSGQILDVLVSGAIHRDRDENLTGSFVIIRDIGERKRADEALRESERKYRELVESANSIILEWDTAGRVTYLNRFGQEFFGFTEDEIIGKNIMGTIVPETETSGRDLQAMIADMRLYPDRYEKNENENIKKNGERVWVSWGNKAMLDADDKLIGALSIGNDVTARHRAEEELRQQNEYLAALHETTLGLLSRLDLADLLEALITRAAQLLGTEHGFVYLVEPDISSPGERVIDRKVGIGVFNQLIGTRLKPGEGLAGKVWQTGQPLVVNDYDNWSGRSAIFDYNVIRVVTGIPLTHNTDTTGSGSEVVGVLGIAYGHQSKRTFGDKEVELLSRFGQLASMALDNARLYSAAQQAREIAETASRTKSVFLANMSHELRTPLNAIIGYSEMLAEEAEDLEQTDFIPDLQKIQGAGQHLLTVINDILDLSKIEAGKMELYLEPFSILDMIRDVIDTIQPLVEKNANILTVDCAQDIGSMRADLTKVRQALFNLLSNATKFTKKGSIALHAARETIDNVDWVTFSVRDTGTGITPEQMRSLFEVFTQAETSTARKYGGTGLGLAITKHFCQMMGGDIIAESEFGVGSTFIIRLPSYVIAPKTLSGAGTEAQFEAVRAGTGSVLVIDDDPDIHALITHYLTKEGFQVVTASSGDEGLRLAKELQPDAITLDVLMPEMDGWAVLTRLKADPDISDIPVIMLSIIEDEDMGYMLGAVDHMTKPIDRNRLVTILKKYRSSNLPAQVLVVEDNAETRDMMRRTLEKEGWAVTEARNGRIALERVNENQPALILLDLMMPEMNGFEFIAELRQRDSWRLIPIVVLTAKDLTKEDRQQLNGSVVKVLQKGNHSREALLEQVYNLLINT
jgi:PAS domain S-box-containing protein